MGKVYMDRQKLRGEVLKHIKKVDIKRAIKNIKKAIKAGDEEMSKWLLSIVSEEAQETDGKVEGLIILPAKEVPNVKINSDKEKKQDVVQIESKNNRNKKKGIDRVS